MARSQYMCRVGHCEDISTLHPREGAVIWQGVVKKYSDYNIILVFEAITLATKKFDPSLDSENRNTTSFETHGFKKKVLVQGVLTQCIFCLQIHPFQSNNYLYSLRLRNDLKFNSIVHHEVNRYPTYGTQSYCSSHSVKCLARFLNNRKNLKSVDSTAIRAFEAILYNKNQNKMSQASFAMAAAIKRVEVLCGIWHN